MRAFSSGKQLSPALTEKTNLITQALRGKPSPANVSWQVLNPSSEGAVYRIGRDCGLLNFAGWAHVSGSPFSEQEAEAAGKKLKSFFDGPDAAYTGPDRDGVHPLFSL